MEVVVVVLIVAFIMENHVIEFGANRKKGRAPQGSALDLSRGSVRTNAEYVRIIRIQEATKILRFVTSLQNLTSHTSNPFTSASFITIVSESSDSLMFDNGRELKMTS
jgi:hypothetical protein